MPAVAMSVWLLTLGRSLEAVRHEQDWNHVLEACSSRGARLSSGLQMPLSSSPSDTKGLIDG